LFFAVGGAHGLGRMKSEYIPKFTGIRLDLVMLGLANNRGSSKPPPHEENHDLAIATGAIEQLTVLLPKTPETGTMTLTVPVFVDLYSDDTFGVELENQSWDLSDEDERHDFEQKVVGSSFVVPNSSGSGFIDLSWNDGAMSDSDRVKVIASDLDITMAAVTIRVGWAGNGSESTDGTSGPDSRSLMGLWKGTLPKTYSADHAQGDFFNGSVDFAAPHPRAVGTGLKAEIYAHIPDPADQSGQWRFVQHKRGYYAGTRADGSIKAYLSNTDVFVEDYVRASTNNLARLDTIASAYLYAFDVPRIVTLTDDDLTDGPGRVKDKDYLTWVERKQGTIWVRVSPKIYWGMTGKCAHDGTKWNVAECAAAKCEPSEYSGQE